MSTYQHEGHVFELSWDTDDKLKSTDLMGIEIISDAKSTRPLILRNDKEAVSKFLREFSETRKHVSSLTGNFSAAIGDDQQSVIITSTTPCRPGTPDLKLISVPLTITTSRYPCLLSFSPDDRVLLIEAYDWTVYLVSLDPLYLAKFVYKEKEEIRQVFWYKNRPWFGTITIHGTVIIRNYAGNELAKFTGSSAALFDNILAKQNVTEVTSPSCPSNTIL